MRVRKRDIAAGVVFAALIVGFAALVGSLTASAGDQESQLVYDAVKNAALTCYAVEGTYPETLDYLRENYSLAYNTDRFVVEYEAFASNVVPVINVWERGSADP